MKEDSVERLFLASLRQALEDIAPEQLEVFQKWFDPADRRPRFHIAPVMGPVSSLSSDPALYEKVMDRERAVMPPIGVMSICHRWNASYGALYRWRGGSGQ